jgi:hypothetical protein
VNSAMIERRPAESGQALPGFPSPHRISSAARRIGLSSAAVAAVATLAYAVIQPLTERPLTAPSPEWHGMAAYAASFDPISLTWRYPAFLLAVAFVIVMTSVHYTMPENRRLWTQLGLVFASPYATVVTVNYTIQLLAVVPSIQAGDTDGLGFFAFTNPHGVVRGARGPRLRVHDPGAPARRAGLSRASPRALDPRHIRRDLRDTHAAGSDWRCAWGRIPSDWDRDHDCLGNPPGGCHGHARGVLQARIVAELIVVTAPVEMASPSRLDPARPPAPPTISRSLAQLGFWSAALAAALTTIWTTAAIVTAIISPIGSWPGIDEYTASFDSRQMLMLVPVLLLAPTFVIVMGCVHAYAAPATKPWALLGLVFAAMYATIASTTYLVQLTVVREHLLTGQTSGLDLLVSVNPSSVAWALERFGYVWMSLALLLAAPVFGARPTSDGCGERSWRMDSSCRLAWSMCTRWMRFTRSSWRRLWSGASRSLLVWACWPHSSTA